ncbi:MAG: hypoxanthine phosphoribosyltransferase [Acidobacteriota bacterium]|nr:MAG: hypoxanthine phosphoribosyltransferase [Acidobacteriota bacterium]
MNRLALLDSDSLALPPIEEIVLDEVTIAARVKELGAEITRDFKGCELTVVGILKGAQVFASELVRKISLPTTLEFMSISRYQRRPAAKEVSIIHDLEQDIAGRHVLIVEDIVDTGLTLNYLESVLRKRNPASISICSLLDRPALRLAEIPMRYVGFNVNEEFLIGYGLDYRDRFRDLPFIATMAL